VKAICQYSTIIWAKLSLLVSRQIKNGSYDFDFFFNFPQVRQFIWGKNCLALCLIIFFNYILSNCHHRYRLKISMNDYQENPWLWADLFIRKSGVSEVNVCLEKSELSLEKKNFTLDYLSSQTNVLSSLCGVCRRNLWGENLPGWFHTWKYGLFCDSKKLRIQNCSWSC
jgi:hypothetical protein